MSKKIMIGAMILVGLISLGLIGGSLINYWGIYGKYECLSYLEQTDSQPIDVLDGYEYYYLELKRGGTFTVTSKLDEPAAEEATASGTFTKNNKVLTLTYDEGQNDIEALIFPHEMYTVDGRTLSRHQTGTYEPTSFTTTITQEFRKVK
jgi:hypothetical protein